MFECLRLYRFTQHEDQECWTPLCFFFIVISIRFFIFFQRFTCFIIFDTKEKKEKKIEKKKKFNNRMMQLSLSPLP